MDNSKQKVRAIKWDMYIHHRNVFLLNNQKESYLPKYQNQNMNVLTAANLSASFLIELSKSRIWEQ